MGKDEYGDILCVDVCEQVSCVSCVYIYVWIDAYVSAFFFLVVCVCVCVSLSLVS